MSASPAPLMLSVSGLRGIVGQTMTPVVAAEFAAAFGSWLREQVAKPTVCLGRDGRSSHEMVGAATISGLLSVGCKVIDLGIVTTPTVGVMIDATRSDGGMVVTASHNPIIWNGLKCLDRSGVAPPKEAANAIIERFRAKRFSFADVLGLGTVRGDATGSETHVERVLTLVDVEAIKRRRFHVVLDSVNGAGGVPGRMLLERLGCEVTRMHAEPVGRFARTPEPTETNLGDLIAALKYARSTGERVTCGFAQDPDADRLAIVDERGEYIGEEYTLVLATKRRLDQRGAGVLATNLSTSRMIDDLAARHPGSKVVRTAVGEANVVAAMKPMNALIGGEGNGGVIVPEVCWVRDSLASMALVLDLLAADGRELSAVVAELPRYHMIKHKFDLASVGGAAAVSPAIERVAKAFADQRVDTQDGVRIDFDDGWVHLRPSNTEPIVRLIAEAGTSSRVWELIDEVAVAAGLK